MFGIFDFLKGTSDKTVNNLLDKNDGLLTQVGSWVGNMNFTDEEQAELNKKLSDATADFAVKTLSENTVRSKSRRTIALLWIKFQILIIFLTMLVAPFSMKLAEFYFTIAFSSLMLSGTLTILAFFFGGYMLSHHLGIGNKQRK